MFQSKFRPMKKIPSSNPDFLLSSPYPAFTPRHWTLIYQAAAGKLTTEPRRRAFRRQFLPVSFKAARIRDLREQLFSNLINFWGFSLFLPFYNDLRVFHPYTEHPKVSHLFILYNFPCSRSFFSAFRSGIIFLTLFPDTSIKAPASTSGAISNLGKVSACPALFLTTCKSAL